MLTKYMMKHGLICILLKVSLIGLSQKYNFVNWTVEDGLIQSQPSVICQDLYQQLWIGTEGGISRFDGKRFVSFTVQDGLISNRITSLFCDRRGTMWIGTNKGLCTFDGKVVRYIKTGNAPNKTIHTLVPDQDIIYALSNTSLFKIEGLKSSKQIITGDTSEIVTALYKNGNRHLMAAVRKKGIYFRENNRWQKLPLKEMTASELSIRKFFISSSSDTFLLTNRGVFQMKSGEVRPFLFKGKDLPVANILSMAEDQNKTIWLGSDKGAYKLESDQFVHLVEKTGFSDNSVQFIYKDLENNLWFCTNGDGIYKFRENTFTYFDKSAGLSSAIVMGIAQTTDGRIYTGGYGGGLYEIDPGDGLRDILPNDLSIKEIKINCLYGDRDNNLLIGTLYEGVWKFNIKDGLKKISGKNSGGINTGGVICFLQDHRNNLLMGAQQGLFLLDKSDSIKTLTLITGQVTTLKQFDSKSVLVGTAKGLYLLDNNYRVSPYLESEFGTTSVLCLAINKNNIWIGTTDEGVLNWDLERKKKIRYNTSNGLPSNFIYSIDVVDKQRAWIGTGFGICNLKLNAEGKILAIKNYGRSDGLLGMECNHNSLLRATDSSLWFGTTKGLFHFNPYTGISELNRPTILLRSVKLFSSGITDSTLYENSETWFNVPHGLKLSSKQNHLTFELGAIYLTNPDNVVFKYKLEGVDKDYTTTGNPLITYPSLPPGKYVLKAVGITKAGVRSLNEINYPFVIEKAFYQTRFFQVIIIILLLGLGALFAFIITRGRQKRKQREKEITEKIREEEFDKLRQRTAEDFHDEMGNNLTRIAVLADVLKSKMAANGPELNKLVQQIKDNTTALYNGSRDIIWSLHSQNDGLLEITEHISDIGRELFQDTGIEFRCEHALSHHRDLRLKLDYSRNLIMIFKEAYNNILKHSGASKVEVTIAFNEPGGLDISIWDNGKGFDHENARSGNGINNMKNRSQRMNGHFEVSQGEKGGTLIHVILTNIFVTANGKK